MFGQKRGRLVLVKFRTYVLVAQCTWLVACGGDNSAEPVDSTDSSGSTNVSDQSVDVAGQSGDSISDSVCSPIQPLVTYELTTLSGSDSVGQPGWYVPSGAPGVYGWDGGNYCDLTSSSGVQRITALIPYTNNPPVIDGRVDPEEWSTAARATWSVDRRDTLLIRNLQTATVNAYLDKARMAEWGAMHDGNYLYLYVEANNEGISASGLQQVYLDSDDPTDDDSVTIYIDGDNSKESQYDGINDFQLTIAHLDTSRTPEFGNNSATGLDINFQTDSEDDPMYTRHYEVKISLPSAGIAVGVPFGFDVHLNEDDNGGVRDALYAWHEASGSNRAATEPGVFGTLVLTGCSDSEGCEFEQSLTGN